MAATAPSSNRPHVAPMPMQVSTSSMLLWTKANVPRLWVSVFSCTQMFHFKCFFNGTGEKDSPAPLPHLSASPPFSLCTSPNDKQRRSETSEDSIVNHQNDYFCQLCNYSAINLVDKARKYITRHNNVSELLLYLLNYKSTPTLFRNTDTITRSYIYS